jgi:hypothetical protein
MTTRRVAMVGAGPACSAASLALTRFRGVEVLLLERVTFPRRKVCGSGLLPWTLDLLAEFGLAAAVGAEAYPIHGALVGGAGREPVELRSKYEAVVLFGVDEEEYGRDEIATLRQQRTVLVGELILPGRLPVIIPEALDTRPALPFSKRCLLRLILWSTGAQPVSTLSLGPERPIARPT